MKRLFKNLSLCLLPILICTCTQYQMDNAAEMIIRDPIDRNANLTKAEMKEAIRPPRKTEEDIAAEQAKKAEPKIPPFSSVVLAPEPPQINSNKKVSLSINENVELRDVMLELARLADLELALDPNIKGGIILSVKNRPINEVLDTVSEMADLRYQVDNGILRVTKDAPYLVNYSADYLNLTRSSKGTMNTQTQVLSTSVSSGSSSGSGSEGGSDGLNSGSNNTITSEYSGDLWKSIEDNLIAILGSNLATQKKSEETQTAKSDSDSFLGDIFGNDEAVVKPADLEAKVKPTEQPGKSSVANTYYTLNKQAGIISIMANHRKHKSIKEYLDRVKAGMSSQVLIEAKVIEVTLNEYYNTGIDWNKFSGNGFVGSIATREANTGASSNIFTSGTLSLNMDRAVKNNNIVFSSVVDMLSGFGSTRALSNPRITVSNNQQAVLTFAENQPYFTVSGTVQQTTTTSSTTAQIPISISSTLHTVPIGVILSLQPSIDPVTQEVTMHIRPTISKTVGDGISDPAVDLLKLSIPTTASSGVTAESLNNITSKVPTVQVRELDTILKAKSGEVMVIGGLITHEDNTGEAGIPFLSDIPIIGNATRRTEKNSQIVETVILIQPIVVPASYYHPQDKKTYETFIQDPRKLVF